MSNCRSAALLVGENLLHHLIELAFTGRVPNCSPRLG
jgi:hypothetical protein